jgi:hypothetical protein
MHPPVLNPTDEPVDAAVAFGLPVARVGPCDWTNQRTTPTSSLDSPTLRFRPPARPYARSGSRHAIVLLLAVS